MSRSNILAIASATLIILGVATSANAEGGGGGGNDRFNEAAAAAARPVAGPRPGAAPGPRASAGSTLPDGTRITSTDAGGGRRNVTTQTPDGRVVTGPRGAVLPKDKANRTVYNSKTGITSTFTRTADGRVTGVHVDKQGNRSVSHSNN